MPPDVLCAALLHLLLHMPRGAARPVSRQMPETGASALHGHTFEVPAGSCSLVGYASAGVLQQTRCRYSRCQRCQTRAPRTHPQHHVQMHVAELAGTRPALSAASAASRANVDVAAGAPCLQIDCKTEYDKVIQETEAAYVKILESSQTLLTVLKRETINISKKKQASS